MTFVDDLLRLSRSSNDLFGDPLKPGGLLGGVTHPRAGAILGLVTNGAANSTGGDFLGVTPGVTPGVPPAPPMAPPAGTPGGGGGSGGGGGGGQFAPFGQPGTDSPPAWLASAALAAYQAGNTKYRDHLLADPTIAGNQHLRNFITGLFAGDPDRIAEAKHYATNPSYNGWNNAAGDGIPGDGK